MFPQIRVEGLGAIALPFSTLQASALKQVRKVADSRSKNLSLGMEYDSDEYSSDEDDLDLFDFMEEAGQTLKANAAAVGEKAVVPNEVEEKVLVHISISLCLPKAGPGHKYTANYEYLMRETRTAWVLTTKDA